MIELTADMESIVKQAMLSFVATILVSVVQRPACRFFSRVANRFGEEGIGVVAVSVADRERSGALVDRRRLGFPATQHRTLNPESTCLRTIRRLRRPSRAFPRRTWAS